MSWNRGGDWIRSTEADERLPWLEPVEEDLRGSALPRKKLWIGLVVSLAVIMAVVAVVGWLRQSEGELPVGSEAGLITAPEGDYKMPPAEPGGMQMEGEGDTIYAAGEGQEPGGTIDLSALPEQPVDRAQMPVEAGDAVAAVPLPPSATPKVIAPAAKAPAPARTEVAIQKAPPAPVKPSPKPAAAAPKPVAAAPAAAGGGTLQLGAFSSKAGAEAAWKALSGRFSFLGGLSKSVEATTSGGKTLYRLRASGPNANELCARLRVAGESCTVVSN